jgi:hypothetical protein
LKNSDIAKAASARSKAQATLERREQIDAEFFRERKRVEAVNLEKTERLKNLRLAKAAADREAAAARGPDPVKVPKARAKKKAPTPAQDSDPSE